MNAVRAYLVVTAVRWGEGSGPGAPRSAGVQIGAELSGGTLCDRRRIYDPRYALPRALQMHRWAIERTAQDASSSAHLGVACSTHERRKSMERRSSLTRDDGRKTTPACLCLGLRRLTIVKPTVVVRMAARHEVIKDVRESPMRVLR